MVLGIGRGASPGTIQNIVRNRVIRKMVWELAEGKKNAEILAFLDAVAPLVCRFRFRE